MLSGNTGISIQVSLGGYSFKVYGRGEERSSGWLGAERIFTTPEFQVRYDSVEISLLTPKCTLVPANFFTPQTARACLGEVVRLRESDAVEQVPVPSLGAVLVFSNSIDESLSKVIAQTVFTTSGDSARVLPEMYYMLRDLSKCTEYNKIIASYRDGWLHLAIAQGKSLLLSNVYEAVDFTTAEYFIFLAMKKLQLNPELSTISFRTPLSPSEEMSLYRYFKSVEVL
ncbi:MAG: DUF3822 family protein [Bacteroidales bacterium]|nr:DUF3822 family protein [Bacteroidales bacterium]